MEVRGATRGERELCLAPTHPPSPRTQWHGRCGARQRLHVGGTVGGRRHPARHDRGRRGGLHDRPAGPALLFDADPPACLWFLARNKNPGKGTRDRRGEVLFIDARKLGHMVDRTRKEFSDEDIGRIAGIYRAWRGAPDADTYEDAPGFCKSATLKEIRGQNHVLTPGRYIGAATEAVDKVPFEERFSELKETLAEQFAEAEELSTIIQTKLEEVEAHG